MTVNDLRNKMIAAGMNPDQYEPRVNADGTVDFVEKENRQVTATWTPNDVTSSKK